MLTLSPQQRESLSFFALEYQRAEQQMLHAQAACQAAQARVQNALAAAGLMPGDQVNFATGEIVRKDEQITFDKGC